MIDEPADAERQAAAALLRLSWGTHISRAVYAAAELGIADLLADGPVSCAELAQATGTLHSACGHGPRSWRRSAASARSGTSWRRSGPGSRDSTSRRACRSSSSWP